MNILSIYNAEKILTCKHINAVVPGISLEDGDGEEGVWQVPKEAVKGFNGKISRSP